MSILLSFGACLLAMFVAAITIDIRRAGLVDRPGGFARARVCRHPGNAPRHSDHSATVASIRRSRQTA